MSYHCVGFVRLATLARCVELCRERSGSEKIEIE